MTRSKRRQGLSLSIRIFLILLVSMVGFLFVAYKVFSQEPSSSKIEAIATSNENIINEISNTKVGEDIPTISIKDIQENKNKNAEVKDEIQKIVVEKPIRRHEELRPQQAQNQLEQKKAENEKPENVILRAKEVKNEPVTNANNLFYSTKKDKVNDVITHVVECGTTVGDLVIDIRENWAPRGTKQFLTLVEQNFFTDLPFFRVCPRYITQFGAKYNSNSDVSVIKDDPSLWGVRDMNYGYLFFAGSGKDSRYNELVFALCDTSGCRQTGLGSAPWEVPFGTVRKEHFDTLKAIENSGKPYPRLEMPGLDAHAKGPDRFQLENDPDYLHREYPFMEYFKYCKVVNNESKQELYERTINNVHAKATTIKAKPKPVKIEASSLRGAQAQTVKQDPFFVEFGLKNLIDESSNEFREEKFVIKVFPSWAPIGAKRFLDLINDGFYDDNKVFRALKKFIIQFGINGTPPIHAKWKGETIPDDPINPANSNTLGTITFATAGPNTRTTQLFINLGNNAYLDSQGFVPFGKVVEGLEVVQKSYFGYGEGGVGDGSDRKGPAQHQIVTKGNKYLDEHFPKLSTILYAKVLEDYVEKV